MHALGPILAILSLLGSLPGGTTSAPGQAQSGCCCANQPSAAAAPFSSGAHRGAHVARMSPMRIAPHMGMHLHFRR